MSRTATEQVFSLMRRILTIDVTRVYRLCLTDLRLPGRIAPDCRFTEVGVAEIKTLAADPELAVDTVHLELLRAGKVKCVAAIMGTKLVGYVWFAEKGVDAQHNTGGPRFKGIGLTLGIGVRYLFKAFITPPFRGQSLMSQLIHAACESLHQQGIREIVTTTDIDNQAFQTSVERIGFKRVGYAAELVLFDRHLFRLPVMDDQILMRRGG